MLLNTAGGLTGGDRIDIDVTLAAGCEATVTTAAAEKIYRSLGRRHRDQRSDSQLGAGAGLHWLPQPTILFDGAASTGAPQVDLAADARLLAVEMLIFGRTAMGEDVHRGVCPRRLAHPPRRPPGVRRHDRASTAPSPMRSTAGATLDGARATAMLVYVAPDAEPARRRCARCSDDASSTAGASTWNGMLLVRAVAPRRPRRCSATCCR